MRLKKIIAPSAAGVECTDTGAINTPGCRVLSFEYLPGTSWGGKASETLLASITYYNASGNAASAQVVSQYEYAVGSTVAPYLRLVAQWDPRISPALKETYAYKQNSYELTSLTPPGEEPWKVAYYPGTYSKLKSVSRASLLESPSTAQTTLVYGVPISGEDAPYDMSGASVAKWGQTDVPRDATAVFPPTEVPGEPPSDYDQATLHYMDADGYEVNTASPELPGASGPSITTTETDVHGNVVRALSAQNRLTALAAGSESAARSHELDSHSVYSSDGTEQLESWGPLHEVRLESGETAQARTHTTTKYDEGAPELKAGESAPRLPTKETVTAAIAGKEDTEPRVTETHYNWPLRLPTEEIVDPNGLNLRTVTVYDDNTGLVTETRQPAQPESTTSPHTTKFIYYTTAANSEFSGCGEKPALAGLPCRKKAASQPGFANPPLLVTVYSTYTNLDQPEVIRETAEGTGHQRTTTNKYDEAGRPTTAKQEITSGDGTALPTVETTLRRTHRPPAEPALPLRKSLRRLRQPGDHHHLRQTRPPDRLRRRRRQQIGRRL